MTEFVANRMTAILRPLAPGQMRMLALSLFAGLLLSTSGAFDTEAAALAPRLAYWLVVALVSTLALTSTHRLLIHFDKKSPDWRLRTIALLLLLVPLTAGASVACKILFGRPLGLAGFTYLLPGMTSILISLQVLISLFSDKQSEQAVARQPVDTLRAALPLPLRGALIHAVQAEDHYVRVHTSAGQALVRMRLRDATACLSAQAGLQPHRSWWVARDSVLALRRSDGRATLTLAGGIEVPVSRRAAQELGPDFTRPGGSAPQL